MHAMAIAFPVELMRCDFGVKPELKPSELYLIYCCWALQQVLQRTLSGP